MLCLSSQKRCTRRENETFKNNNTLPIIFDLMFNVPTNVYIDNYLEIIDFSSDIL